MDVLFLAQGRQAPSSRYRVEQLLPHFREAGVRCTTKWAYGERYNQLAGTVIGVPYKSFCRMKGAVNALRATGYDVVVAQKMALPHTGLPEGILASRGSPVVFDFDDAVYLGPDGGRSRLRERAFRRVVAASSWVVAGNAYLAEVAGASHKTTVIPTAIDTDLYTPGLRRAEGPPIVGWMGTAGNFQHLLPVLPSVLAAVERVGARLRIVSNATLNTLVGHPSVDQIRWSPAREVELLQSFDIGLMPLNESEQARGKCGFKLIQYMAVGAPVVASAVGANVEILDASGGGALVAADERDWSAPLLRLLENSELRTRQGSAGRDRCVARYSAAGAAERYLEVFRRVAHA